MFDNLLRKGGGGKSNENRKTVGAIAPPISACLLRQSSRCKNIKTKRFTEDGGVSQPWKRVRQPSHLKSPEKKQKQTAANLNSFDWWRRFCFVCPYYYYYALVVIFESFCFHLPRDDVNSIPFNKRWHFTAVFRLGLNLMKLLLSSDLCRRWFCGARPWWCCPCYPLPTCFIRADSSSPNVFSTSRGKSLISTYN
jgi:hypothetical protein